MEPKEVAPDSEMGRRPIYRCLFAALGSIREVHHLTHRILASEMGQVPFVGAVYGKMTLGVAKRIRGLPVCGPRQPRSIKVGMGWRWGRASRPLGAAEALGERRSARPFG